MKNSIERIALFEIISELSRELSSEISNATYLENGSIAEAIIFDHLARRLGYFYQISNINNSYFVNKNHPIPPIYKQARDEKFINNYEKLADEMYHDFTTVSQDPDFFTKLELFVYLKPKVSKKGHS